MTTATAPRQLAALLVAHAQLVPSLTNPRKRFDKARLEELALSMAPPVGILEPLVVRTLPEGRNPAGVLKGPGPFYEIIAGERRWRAAAIAKLEEIPIVIREIADDQVIKLQLVENKNREDIHPLDEAEAMERLLRINKAETPKTIAATIGMSERYVQNRLHYLRLVPEVKEAFRTEVLTAGHVDLLMRLPADEQTRAFKEGLYDEQFDYDDDTQKNTKRLELRSVRNLGDWIAGHVRLPLDAKSPQLELLPDVAQAVTESAAPGAPTLVELSDSYGSWQGKGPAPLLRGQWEPVKKGEKCDSQVRGVIVIGRARGRILTVCTGVGVCKKHWPHTVRQDSAKSSSATKATPAKKTDWEIKQAKERAIRAEQERLWKTVQPAAIKIVREKFVALKGSIALAVIGDELREQLFTAKIPKLPTLADLLGAIVDNAGEDQYAVGELAKRAKVDLKPLFKAAATKVRFSKMSDQEAGAAAIREAAKKKAAPKKVDKHTAATVASHARAKQKAKRKAGAKK